MILVVFQCFAWMLSIKIRVVNTTLQQVRGLSPSEILLREKETVLELKKLLSTCTRRIQRAYKYKDVQQVLDWQKVSFVNQKCEISELSCFCKEGRSIKNQSLS